VVVIALRRDSFSFKFGTTIRPVTHRPSHQRRDIGHAVQNFAFINWRRRIGKMVLQMDDMVEPGTTLTLFSSLSRREQTERLEAEGVRGDKLKNLNLKHMTGGPAQMRDLRLLTTVGPFNSIFVFTTDNTLASAESDTELMSTALLLSELFPRPKADGRAAHGKHRGRLDSTLDSHDPTVSPRLSYMKHGHSSRWSEADPTWDFESQGSMQAPASAHLYEPAPVGCIMCELVHKRHKALFKTIDNRIVPVCADEIAASAISQVSLQPEMKPIFRELLTAVGCELRIIPAIKVLGIAVEEDMSWTEIMSACRGVRMVAVGYSTTENDMTLNPLDRQLRRRWDTDDLIVLADP